MSKKTTVAKTETEKDAASKMTLFKLAGAEDGSIRSTAQEYEDEFKGFYGFGKFADGVHVIEPPYNVKQLEALVQTNNTLRPCIDAMTTNVHGTGYEITPEEERDDSYEEDQKIKDLAAFFKQPYPGVSWTTMRKQIGNDVESTGNAYLEVIRNLEGQMVFVRRLDPKLMRMVKLDEPRVVDMELDRNGTTFTAKVARRFRRFAQMIGSHKIFFKEYGCPEQLSKKKGLWVGEGPKDLRPDDQIELATEIIHLTKMKDSETPYGVPVWVTQIPSVLGSRRAEEQNLAYFDNGGVPPMIVFVSGGSMSTETRKGLESFFGQTSAAKSNVPVVEIASSGTLEKSSAVSVNVERFGSERQNDSMFEKYDERCEMRIRRAWRLPPIFVGGIESYNFATAFASYTVAEAQVFAPERDEFDEVVNNTIMSELDSEGYEYCSKPLTVRDIEHQMKGLELVWKAGELTGKQLIDKLNDILDLGLKYEEPEEGEELEQPNPQDLDIANDTNAGTEPAAAQGNGTPVASPARKSDLDLAPVTLAADLFEAMSGKADQMSLASIVAKIVTLEGDERDQFRTAFLEELSEGAVSDDEDMAQIAAAAMLVTDAN